MRSFEVVFVGVIAGRRIDFAQVEEELAIQQFQANLGMEAFDISVLPRLRLTLRAAFGRLSRCARFPRSAGFNITWTNLCLAQPLLHGLGHELRPVVTADVLRLTAAADHDLFQGVDDSSGREAAGRFEQQAFPRVFVDNRQDAHRAAISRAVLDEVVAPDLVGPTRTATQGPTRTHPAALAAMTSRAV